MGRLGVPTLIALLTWVRPACALHQVRKIGHKYFVVIAPHRSGSGMLMSLLDTHPEVGVAEEEYQCYSFTKANWGPACKHNETLADTCHRLSSNARRLGFKGTTIGFKLMSPEIRFVSGGLGQHLPADLTYVVHWRRNHLRALISLRTGEACTEKLGVGHPHCYHPDDNKTAAFSKQINVSLEAGTLVSDLDAEFDARRGIMGRLRNMSATTPMCVSHYEDWLDLGTRTAQMRGLQRCLGLPKLNLTTDLVPIHQNRPVLTTISNGDDIRKALRGTRYEFMLEEAPSQAAVYKLLERADDLDHSRTKLA